MPLPTKSFLETVHLVDTALPNVSPELYHNRPYSPSTHLRIINPSMTTRNLLLPIQLLKVSVSELILADWKGCMKLAEARRGDEGKR